MSLPAAAFAVGGTYSAVVVVGRRRGCLFDFVVVNVASPAAFDVVVVAVLTAFTSLLFTALRSVMPK